MAGTTGFEPATSCVTGRRELKLKPDTIVLTSVDADHLDIYKSKESLIDSFKEFTSLIAQQDKLIVEESINKLFINNLSYGHTQH